MPFYNRRGRGRGRGGKDFNDNNPNKLFRRNVNRPGGIRKDFQEEEFSNKPLRNTNRPPFKSKRRGRGRGGRSEGTDNRPVSGKHNGKFSSDNLDKEMDSYWGKEHKETRERILNDDLDSYWEKKPSKGETTNESQQQASENIAHIETQEANKPTEHVENVVHLPKKKNVVESVPL